jgi:hypothetical protein
MTETPAPAPGTDVEPAGKRPARGYSWPPFAPGHELSLKHGAWSPRKVGERAQVVRDEILDLVPGLADDPESASPLALYCRAVAREELCHEAIENGNMSPRLVEASSTSARVAKELGDAIGLGPRASAELRQIRAQTALTMSELARQAPEVLEAVRRTLAALGLDARSDEFEQQLAYQLEEVAGDDEDD